MGAVRFLESLDRACEAVLRHAVSVCIVAVLALLTLGIVSRAVPVFSMTGYDEIIELLFAWMTFMGAVLLWRDGSLFRVEFLQSMLGREARRILQAGTLLLMLLFAVVFTWEGWVFGLGTIEMTAFLNWPKNAWYISMPVAGTLMILYTLAALWRLARGADGDDEPW